MNEHPYVYHTGTGMDYYAYHQGVRIHIGRAARGWVFAFRSIPERGLVNVDTWLDFLMEPEVTIVDANDDSIIVTDFWKNVRDTTRSVKYRMDSGRYIELFPKQEIYGDDYLDGPYRFVPTAFDR